MSQTYAFLQDDGTWSTSRNKDTVKLIDLGTIAEWARQASPIIIPGWVVGTCVSETNRDQDYGGGCIANERDLDV